MSNAFSLENKVVAVVGAASGIGAAVAQGAAEQGAKVVCLDLDSEGAGATAQRIGGTATSETIDIMDGPATIECFKKIAETHGSLDGVACTPAVNVRKPLLEYTDEEFDRVIGLNLKGGLHVFQGAGPLMAEQKQGSIVMFSSIRSLVVEPGQGIYAATKAGILQMVRTLAAELGPSGVRVNAVGPGVVETPLTAPIKAQKDWHQAYADRNIFKRWAQPEEMAGPTVFLLSDAASYVTGTNPVCRRRMDSGRRPVSTSWDGIATSLWSVAGSLFSYLW